MSLTVATALALLGAAASAGGSIAAMGRNKQTENSLLGQKSDLDTEYYLGLLEDPGYKSYIKELDRQSRESLRGIDNSVVSSGATAENALAQKARSNELVDNAVGRAIQREEQNKKYYFSARNQLGNQLGTLRAQQAQNWMNIASNVAKSAGALGESYLDDGIGGGGGAEAPRLFNKGGNLMTDADITADMQKTTDALGKSPKIEEAPKIPAEKPKPLDNNILPSDDEDEERRKGYSQA